nr:ribonuclease H-like domain-containing protein [Tanacetum cinerariifolium]
MAGDDNNDGDHPETSKTSPPVPPPTQQIPHINRNGHVSVTTDTNGMVKVLPPKIAKEVVARERERKPRTTLLMALPKDHLAKFHKMANAKEMWEAIKSRFSGNDESKKMQKYLFKQQFEEIYGAGVSHEDANQKFLRSLPSSWSQVALIMRTKPGLDTLSFDDLYNNLRVFERDVKGTTASSSNTQNVAFVSTENTSRTNDVSTAYSVSSLSISKSQKEGSSSYTDEVIHSFFANQSSAPQLDYDDLKKINDDDMEEMDSKWQLVLIRPKWNASIAIKWGILLETIELKGTKIAEEEMLGTMETKLETMVEDMLVRMTQKLWLPLMKRILTGLDMLRKMLRTILKKLYDEQRDKLGDASVEITVYTLALKKESDVEDTPVNDRYDNGMHVVPPLMTEIYMPSGPDVEIDYSKFTYGPKQTSADKSYTKPSKYASCESDSSLETSTSMPEPVENTSKDDPHRALKDKGIVDNGCSRHMTGNKAHLADYQEFKGGSVAFGGRNGRIIGKGKIKASMLDFEDVYYVEELNHCNLFFVSQMCDKKNKVLFTDTDCLVLSPDFKLPDENQKGKQHKASWIKREYSNARTPQQNGVAERKKMTLIEVARTMVLVTKPQNKTPYELLTGKQSIISYLRPFGYHVTILNTIDQLGKFDRKSDLGFLVGYFLNRKAFRVYNLETKRVEENLHVNFLENKPNVAGKGHAWMFDLDYLTNSINYEPVLVENQANKSAGPKDANDSADESLRKEAIHDIKNANTSSTNLINTASTPLSTDGPSRAFNDGELSYLDEPLMPHLEDIYASPREGIFTDSSYDDEGVVTDFNNLETTTRSKVNKNSEAHALVWILVDLPFGKKEIMTKWVYRNKKDEKDVVDRNKA